MPPKEPETLEERMYRVELLHEQQEKDFVSMSIEFENVRALASDAKSLAIQTNGMVIDMPNKVIEAIEEKNRTKKLDMKEWILASVGFLTLLTLLPAAWQAVTHMGVVAR